MQLIKYIYENEECLLLSSELFNFFIRQKFPDIEGNFFSLVDINVHGKVILQCLDVLFEKFQYYKIDKTRSIRTFLFSSEIFNELDQNYDLSEYRVESSVIEINNEYIHASNREYFYDNYYYVLKKKNNLEISKDLDSKKISIIVNGETIKRGVIISKKEFDDFLSSSIPVLNKKNYKINFLENKLKIILDDQNYILANMKIINQKYPDLNASLYSYLFCNECGFLEIRNYTDFASFHELLNDNETYYFFEEELETSSLNKVDILIKNIILNLYDKFKVQFTESNADFFKISVGEIIKNAENEGLKIEEIEKALISLKENYISDCDNNFVKIK